MWHTDLSPRLTCDVPPPGIEPGPLGLQPSAQTSYARVGLLGCLPAPSSSLLFGCHRSIPAEDAPRATMHPQDTRTHPSRPRAGVLNPRSRVAKTLIVGDVGRCSARNVEGPPGISGGPSARVIDQITSWQDLRGYPDANRNRARVRRAQRTAARDADRATLCDLLSGYVVNASTQELLDLSGPRTRLRIGR
jgi:hypothetical protein